MAETKKDAILQRFLHLTGYAESDVIGYRVRTFVTSNGGKYVLNNRGTEVRRLSGPAAPKAVEEAEEE